MVKFNIQTTTRFNEIMRMCGDTTNKIILELGAGRYKLAECFREYKKSITMDAVGRPTIKCDLNKGIKLKNNSVDIIIAGEIIEHLRNPEFILNECKRVLKKNGILVLSVPNCCSFKLRIKLLFGILDTAFCVPADEEFKWEKHNTDFSYEIIKNLLNKVGFEIKDYQTEGIIVHSTKLFPRCLSPKTFGDGIILKCEIKK